MKRKDLVSKINSMGYEELRGMLNDSSRELMMLRFKNASGQLEQSHRIREVKKEIARINTAISQAAQA